MSARCEWSTVIGLGRGPPDDADPYLTAPASIPMARQFGLALAPWDAIGSGRLLSKKQLEARLESGEKMRGQGGNEQTELERKYSEVLEEVGKEHNVDSVTAVALACESLWTLCA